MKAGDLIEAVNEQFERADLHYGHGTDNPWDEAVALVLGVTAFADDEELPRHPVPEVAVRKILALAERRIVERQPLPYLLGRCTFAGHEFLVDQQVIIPRSPIGELILTGFRPWLRRRPARILDLCCGTGCIGIAAALEFPGVSVVLADISDEALELARKNVAHHGVGDRVSVVRSDVYAGIDGRFDLILANPPYVDAADLASAPAEYRHEPPLALDGGADGLKILRMIIDELPAHLDPGGVLIGEAGGSAAALSRAYPALPFIWVDLENGGEGVFVLDAPASGMRS